MRVRVQLPTLCVAILALGGMTCSGSPPPGVLVAPAPVSDPTAFKAARAWAHLEALAGIGPRVMGTPGAARAREYILGQLKELGVEVRVQEVKEVRPDGVELVTSNVAAVVPGESSNLFLVVAPYDSRAYESFENLGVNDGASGVAVALELARVIAAQPLPYTTWFVFLEGEQPAPGEAKPARIGSRGLASVLRDRDALEQVRLALVVNRVCDPDLRIARDLASHRVYREEFWRAAARLGFAESFAPDAGFEQPDESHRALAEAGVRRVVALADTSFGGDRPPGPYAGTEDDDLEHCSAKSLGVVGAVSLEGLSVIAQRLRRIDRFAESPIAGAEALRLEQLSDVGVSDDAPPEAPSAQVPAAEPVEAASPTVEKPSAPAEPATDAQAQEPAPEAGP